MNTNPAAQPSHVEVLRQAASYINTFRDSTLVLHCTVPDWEQVANDPLMQDIALLKSLGLRLVLIAGLRARIDQALQDAQIECRYQANQRITDRHVLTHVLQQSGIARAQIEAALSAGMPNTALSGAHLSVVSGNFVTARPVGVEAGVDMERTGLVRGIDTANIRRLLDQGHIVLLTPIGYSRTGEPFNLHTEEVATEAAMALQADKLIFLSHEPCPQSDGKTLRQLTPNAVDEHLSQGLLLSKTQKLRLMLATKSVRGGVRRAHLLEHALDGALLTELFSRDGCGTLISADSYEGLRQACIDDVGGLIALINATATDNALVPRAREELELDINKFYVIERDGMIIATGALFIHDDASAEIACLVAHPDYRGGGRAARILEHLIERAQQRQALRVFVLTTRTAHWFIERGFQPGTPQMLPTRKQHAYDHQRRSQVFIKSLR